MNLTSRLLLSVQVGDFAWSAGQLVDAFSEERGTLDLYPQGTDGRALSGQGVGASLSTMVTLDEYQTAHIKIFSRFALADRSGLDVSVRTRRRSSKGTGDGDFFNSYSTVERHTFAKRRPVICEEGGRAEKVDAYADFDDGDRRSFFSDEWDPLGSQGLLSPRYALAPSLETPNVSNGLAGASWSHGAHGLVLFHSDPQDSKFSLGVNRGGVWSEPMSLLTLGASKVPFELIDKNTQCAYQLAHSTSQLPGAFKATQLVTVMPCYCVVNCLDEHIELRQVGALASDVNKEMADLNKLLFPGSDAADLTPSRKKCSVAAKSSAGWHRHDLSKGTAVQVRCDSSAWSLGTVDLNQIGTTVLLVPKKRLYPPTSPSTGGAYAAAEPHSVEDGIVLHVEVRFADPTDNSYVNIVVWAPSPDKDGCCHKAALSVRNDTVFPIIITQTGTDRIARKRRADPSRFSLQVPSGAWKPFGWADPEYGTSVTVTLVLPPSSYSSHRRYEGSGSDSPYPSHHSHEPVTCEIDILKIGQSATMHLSDTYSPHSRDSLGDIIDLTVTAVAGGQVLHVTTNTLHNSTHTDRRSPSPRLSITDDKGLGPRDAPQRDFTLVLSLKSVGVSLIAERPVRREFLSVYLDGIEGRMVCKHVPLGEGTEKKGQNSQKGQKGRDGRDGRDGTSDRLIWDKSEGEAGDERVQQKAGSVFTSYELELNDMQIDNYSETAVFPVLLHSFSASHRERKKAARRRKRAIRRTTSQGQGQGSSRRDGLTSSKSLFEEDPEAEAGGGVEDFPFLALSVILERSKGSDTPIFKYVAVRLLEIKLAVDSSTLQLYFCDLHADLRGESREEALAGEMPMEWARQFNQQMVVAGYRPRERVERGKEEGGGTRNKNDFRLNNSIGQLVDLPKTLRAAQEGKMYFETLIIHPMKLRLSFLPTPFPRSKHEDILSAEEYRGFKIVRAIAQVGH